VAAKAVEVHAVRGLPRLVRVPTDDVGEPTDAADAVDVEVVLGCRVGLAIAIVAAEGGNIALDVSDDGLVVQSIAKLVGQAVDGGRGVVAAKDAALAGYITTSLAPVQAIVRTVSGRGVSKLRLNEQNALYSPELGRGRVSLAVVRKVSCVVVDVEAVRCSLVERDATFGVVVEGHMVENRGPIGDRHCRRSYIGGRKRLNGHESREEGGKRENKVHDETVEGLGRGQRKIEEVAEDENRTRSSFIPFALLAQVGAAGGGLDRSGPRVHQPRNSRGVSVRGDEPLMSKWRMLDSRLVNSRGLWALRHSGVQILNDLQELMKFVTST
jgi:hypothetical protein